MDHCCYDIFALNPNQKLLIGCRDGCDQCVGDAISNGANNWGIGVMITDQFNKLNHQLIKMYLLNLIYNTSTRSSLITYGISKFSDLEKLPICKLQALSNFNYVSKISYQLSK